MQIFFVDCREQREIIGFIIKRMGYVIFKEVMMTFGFCKWCENFIELDSLWESIETAWFEELKLFELLQIMQTDWIRRKHLETNATVATK